jgi:hypothetical protein
MSTTETIARTIALDLDGDDSLWRQYSVTAEKILNALKED